ncbi:MAG: phosphatidylserine decarboxylase family protein [Deltaproteobacteria bacterium]|nr:phosphatidylserine decarboxylase family protein [Deltaproteobacteria bacterium]
MSIAREGYPFILVAALLALLALVVGWKWVALACVVFAFAFLGQGEGLILAPADGRVVAIRRADKEGLFAGAETRVSIFLSPLDVHVNRAPIRARVEQVRYREGGFLAAYREEASEGNENNALSLVDAEGRRLGVVQIAGVLARRIVCYVKQGDVLERGQRFGLIMFGSRVDLFLPRGARVDVVERQRVRAGETVIGRLP